MAGSTNKKVVVERFERANLTGYLNRASFLTDEGVELMDVSGNVSTIPLANLKAVLFVRDFPDPRADGLPWVFQARPKMNGLWIRMRFQDREAREGLMPNNLLDFAAHGLMVTPPNLAGNVMQAFIPRLALTEIEVLGVVGSPLRRPSTKTKRGADQIGLFG